MAKYILKNTHQKTAVKVAGSGVAETITLATDLKLAGETLDATQTVTIVSLTWTGDANAKATITRSGNATPIAILQGNAPASVSFADTEFVESVTPTADIVVTTVGEMQVYLLLRKQSGYIIADPQQYSQVP